MQYTAAGLERGRHKAARIGRFNCEDRVVPVITPFPQHFIKQLHNMSNMHHRREPDYVRVNKIYYVGMQRAIHVALVLAPDIAGA